MSTHPVTRSTSTFLTSNEAIKKPKALKAIKFPKGISKKLPERTRKIPARFRGEDISMASQVREVAKRTLPARTKTLPARYREETKTPESRPAKRSRTSRVLPVRLPSGITHTALPFVHPEYKEAFEKFWDETKEILVPKRPNVEEVKFQRSINRILKDGDDSYHSSKVRVSKINKAVGMGVFARERINSGSVVGVYSGAIRKFDDADDADGNGFIFGFHQAPEMEGWMIDGRTETAFMNHASSVSPYCNVIPFEYFSEEGPMIVFVATKTIQPGDQLLYDYGDRYWENLGIIPQSLK